MGARPLIANHVQPPDRLAGLRPSSPARALGRVRRRWGGCGGFAPSHFDFAPQRLT